MESNTKQDERTMDFIIDTERLASVSVLSDGGHSANDGLMCAMEAVAWIAREPWSDHPKCACPVIGAFMRSWNDGLPNDEERNRLLLPLIPKLVGTRASEAIEQRRAKMAADWLIRTHTVAWLRLAKLDAQADALASLPEITDFTKCPSLMPALEAVRRDAAAARDAAGAAAGDAAWDAAWAAAWDAAWAAAWDAAWAAARDAAWAAAWDAARDAAWDAARDAARDAAWDAAWAAAGDAAWDAAWAAAWDAAWAAAGDAAWDAAWDAARDAAWAAAGDALKQTTEDLQHSAISLVERMIAVTEDDV